ncbi:hypothetical protein [Spirosoma arcticum]
MTEIDAEKKPPSDLKSLDRLAGTWKVSDPSGKAAIDGEVTYQWLDGGFFLMQHFDFVHSGRQIKGIEIIGHLQPFGGEPGKDIQSRIYDSAGNTFDYVYELDGDTLTIWGGERGSAAFYKGTFSPDGNTNSGAWVYPGGGGYASAMTRIR